MKKGAIFERNYSILSKGTKTKYLMITVKNGNWKTNTRQMAFTEEDENMNSDKRFSLILPYGSSAQINAILSSMDTQRHHASIRNMTTRTSQTDYFALIITSVG